MTTAGGHVIPAVRKTPLWVPAVDGQPRWHLGLYSSSKGARAQVGQLGGAIRVWVAVEVNR